MARQMTRSELVRSWAFFAVGWGLVGAYLLLNDRYAGLAKLVMICIMAMAFWRLLGKTPEQTILQVWVSILVMIFTLGNACRLLWDSLVVIPIMAGFAFFCLFAVVLLMVQVRRTMRFGFGK